MPAWSTGKRRGQGIIAGMVVILVALALTYALSQSQAQSGALTGVARAACLRSVQWAGRSCLDEVAFRLSLPPANGADPMKDIRDGRTPSPMEPEGSRQIYADALAHNELTLSPVTITRVGPVRAADSRDPWFIDLAVTVSARLGTAQLTRTMTRRHVARQHFITMTLGPRAGQRLQNLLVMDPGFLFEVMK